MFYNTQIPPSIIAHDLELRHAVGPGYRSRASSAFVQACGHSQRVTKPRHLGNLVSNFAPSRFNVKLTKVWCSTALRYTRSMAFIVVALVRSVLDGMAHDSANRAMKKPRVLQRR